MLTCDWPVLDTPTHTLRFNDIIYVFSASNVSVKWKLSLCVFEQTFERLVQPTTYDGNVTKK